MKESKLQAIKTINFILKDEHKVLSLKIKTELLEELRKLEYSLSLSSQVKNGDWVIKTAKNMYYQFVRLTLGGVFLIRNGEQRMVTDIEFNSGYRLANPDEVKQHESFLAQKKIEKYNLDARERYNDILKKRNDKALEVLKFGTEIHDLLEDQLRKHLEPSINPMKCDFYMVTCTGLHGSKVRHTSYEEAQTEAIRIAKKRNHEAWIVGVVASVKPVIETHITHIPKIEIKKR